MMLDYSRTIVNDSGKISHWKDVHVPILDRSFLYGDSAYEVTRTYRGNIAHLKRHFIRLEKSLHYLRMKGFNLDEIENEIYKTNKEISKSDDYYIRFICSRGMGPIELSPNSAPKPKFYILFTPIIKSGWERVRMPKRVMISSTKRPPEGTLAPWAKTGNYLTNVLALGEAKDNGFDDAVVLNTNGKIAECTTSNFWIVTKNQIITPPAKEDLLLGITRQVLLEKLKVDGFEVTEKAISINEAYEANEIFTSSSVKGIVPIIQINEKKIGDGKTGTITKMTNSWYENFSDSEAEKETQEYSETRLLRNELKYNEKRI